MPLVQCGTYTYYTDLPVKVGDKVIVTVSSSYRSVYGPVSQTTVTALQQEGNYRGPFENIVMILPRIPPECEAIIKLRERIASLDKSLNNASAKVSRTPASIRDGLREAVVRMKAERKELRAELARVKRAFLKTKD